jgi:hypothetical protein
MYVVTIMCNMLLVASGKPTGAMATHVSSFSMMYAHMRFNKLATPMIISSSTFVVDTSTSSSYVPPIEAIVVSD